MVGVTLGRYRRAIGNVRHLEWTQIIEFELIDESAIMSKVPEGTRRDSRMILLAVPMLAGGRNGDERPRRTKSSEPCCEKPTSRFRQGGLEALSAMFEPATAAGFARKRVQPSVGAMGLYRSMLFPEQLVW